MGQSPSSFRLWSSNDLGLILHRTYCTQYFNITSLKIQPIRATVFIAANEAGTILMYDLQSDYNTAQPQQYKVLSFEYGGASELFWINADIFVVGTTRGWLIVFSLKNEKRRMFEVCKVKAHGDGAAQVAVQAIDYSSTSKYLVSVGQGNNSICLWDVTADGVLTPRPIEKSPTAYCEPRFVAFCNGSSQLLIGYLEEMTIQKFSLDTSTFLDHHVLGHKNGYSDNRYLGNAILLTGGRLVVYNLKDGLDIYETTTFSIISSLRFDINHCSSQGVSTLRGGSYLLSSSQKGRIHIFRAQDAKYAGRIHISGRANCIQAIDSITDQLNRDIVVSSSSNRLGGQPGPSQLSVWLDSSNKRFEGKVDGQSKVKIGETGYPALSTMQVVLLCIAVYTICQLVTVSITKGSPFGPDPTFLVNQGASKDTQPRRTRTEHTRVDSSSSDPTFLVNQGASKDTQMRRRTEDTYIDTSTPSQSQSLSVVLV